VTLRALLLALAIAAQLPTIVTHLHVLVDGGAPPAGPVYTALSDHTIKPKPAPLVLGPAGFAFTDPTFGSKLWRVTDASTSSGSSLRVQSSAHGASWNSDGSKFFVMNEGGGAIFFAFDPIAGPKQLLAAIPSQIEPSFSYVDPTRIFGAEGHVIKNYSVVTDDTRLVFDLNTLGLNLGADTYIGGFLNEDHDTWVTFFGGTGQDHHFYVRTSTGVQLDTRPRGFFVHAVGLDRTGRYVFIYPANDPNTGRLPAGVAQVQLWDTQRGTLTPITNLPAGHDSAGYGVWVNADCCTAGTWDASQWQIRNLATPNSPSNLIPSVLTPQEVYLAEHSNWRAARPDVKVPIVSASYRYGAGVSQVDYPWRAWDEEIIAVATDGSGTVWRFAHTQSIVGVQPEFWAEPIVNCAPDGHHCLFTSNWGVAGGRQDVLLVELR
jgi:hypothetical protein